MKKTFALVLVLILALSLSIPVFAATGGFLSSPTRNPAILVSGTSSDENFNGELVITPYPNRDNLSEEEKKDLDAAYSDIAANSNLSDLIPNIGSYSSNKGVPVKALAVQDLFYVHATDTSAEKASYDLTLKIASSDKFVALAHYSNGKWSVVDSAKIDADGNLTFKTENLGAFALVVNASASSNPNTSDSLIGISFGVSALIVAAAVVSRKFSVNA